MYNLEERTAKFGENVIQFCKELEQNIISKPIINQLIRSATSIGANYMEAKRTEQVPEKISKTKYLSVKKKRRKQNTG